MKEELLSIGFKETDSPFWLKYESIHFVVDFCMNGYFVIVLQRATKDGISYPYNSISKLQSLITANEQYFK